MANSPVNSQGGEIERFPRKPYSYPSPQAAAEIWNRRRQRRRRRIVSLAVVLAVALPAILLSQWSLAYAAGLPDVSQLSNDVPGDSFVYASDNKTVLADLHPAGYQHYYEPLSDMGKALPTAIVAIEDRNFYNEPGVDPAGIARAAIVDIKAGDTQQGASTITQQLVKVRLLDSSPTIQRKFTEAVLAFAVEHRYSKDEILEMYLNSVSFGNTAVGTAAASQIFFHKKTSQLDLAQASMLAGLVRGPTLYSPFQNWDAARARQHDVLSAMVDAGKISQPQADAAYKEDLSPPSHMFRPSSTVIAPGFVSYVTQELVKKWGGPLTYGGALRVYTTLNTKLQAVGQSAITGTQASLAWRNVQQGALVAIDPSSGAIIAMVSSANPKSNGGQYNLAVWPPRNPGSSMKIYTYTAAIASGRYTMTTSITDAPLRYVDPGSQKVYAPQNYDGRYHGTCQLQVCMGNSFNIPAVKVELGVGVSNVVDMARAMGAGPWQQHADGSFSNDDGTQDFGPSLTLGGYGETPLQMATGASVLAAQGVLHQPYAIAKVDQAGSTLFEHQDSSKQVIDPKVAFIMSTMLSRDANRAEMFGRDSLLTIPGWQVAVKTGTSDSFADAWTVGYTPKIAVAVWMGNPDWRIKMLDGSDSYYVAVPAWHAFLAAALPVLGAETWYSPPAGIVSAWDNYYLPGTAPDSPPIIESTPSPSPTGGHRHHKKRH
jgi:membrane peptidoglycan carboxypeptidase